MDFGWWKFSSTKTVKVKVIFMHPFKFLSVNFFFSHLYLVFSATNRLVHVCAAVLPAQSESATTQDPRSVLLSSVLVAVAQNRAFPRGHAECHFHQRWIHVSN